MDRLGDRRFRARRAQPQRAMRPRPVVVRGIPGKHASQVPFPKISIRSVTSARTVNTNRSAKQFARGHRGGILTASLPASATVSNEAVNFELVGAENRVTASDQRLHRQPTSRSRSAARAA